MVVDPHASPGAQRIRRYFDEQDWPVSPVESGAGVNWAFRGENGEWYGQTWWLDDVEQLLVYSICPLPIPEPSRAAVAELVALINAELVVGCWECDADTGQVRFRVGLSIAPAELSDSAIDRAVRTNVLTTDRYLPALIRVAAGVPATAALRDTADTRAAVPLGHIPSPTGSLG